MRAKSTWLSKVLVIITVGLAFAGAPVAQTTKATEVRNFEIIMVDGNTLVVRDERGTNQVTVPDDFRFMVDGRPLSVKELTPGMKGTATVTTTTTIKPVVVTEIREGVVLSAGPQTMIVRDAEGVRKRFSQDQLDERGIQILKGGRAIRIGEVKEGDVLTATVFSKGPPVVMTEQEVQATLAQSKAAPTPATAAPTAAPGQPTAPAASPATAPAPSPATAPAASPATPPPSSTTAPAPGQSTVAAASPAASPVAPPAASTTAPAPRPAEQSGIGLPWIMLILVLIALVVYFFVRGKKKV